MMAEKGLMTPHEGDGSCVAMEQGMRRDGKNSASQGRKKAF